jgi:hypothetical protein
MYIYCKYVHHGSMGQYYRGAHNMRSRMARNVVVIQLYYNVKHLLTQKPEDGHVDWPKHVAWSTNKYYLKEYNKLCWIIYTRIIIFMVIYNTTVMYCSNVKTKQIISYTGSCSVHLG